jgi:hypothetical protein
VPAHRIDRGARTHGPRVVTSEELLWLPGSGHMASPAELGRPIAGGCTAGLVRLAEADGGVLLMTFLALDGASTGATSCQSTLSTNLSLTGLTRC